MNLSPTITDDEQREQMMNLAFSLYECLGDLMSDVMDYEDPDHNATNLGDRISTSAMNCLADIKLLAPRLKVLMAMRYAD